MRSRRLRGRLAGSCCVVLWSVTVGSTSWGSHYSGTSGDAEVTYARDIAPILDAECVVCHRDGQSAPFPLQTFQQARRYAAQIAVVTESGFMPPWLPAPNADEFRGARRLEDSERKLFAQWARAGAPEGDPAARPAPPSFATEWFLGPPDLIVRMERPYVVPAEGGDVFRNFILPTDEPRARHVRAFDLAPGNARVVHHAVLQVDENGSARHLDGADGQPGFQGMESTSDAVSPGGFFLGWTPGKTPYGGTPGLAWTLEPGADLVLNLHLQPTGKPEELSATVALYFTDDPPRDRPLQLRLGSETIDIAAGERDWKLTDRYELPVAVELLGLYPHAHYLATEMQVRAILPTGKVRSLLHIPQWDFLWQDDYAFATPVALPAGTALEIDYRYDNSDQNPFNPASPPTRVRYGPRSADEMGDLWLQVVALNAGERETLASDAHARDARRKIDGLRFALEHEPRSADSHAELGYWLLVVGDARGALQHLERAVELDPEQARAHNNLGYAALRAGRPVEAQHAFERSMELQPDAADPYNNVGLTLLEQGRAAESERYFERALERRKLFPEALNNLGRARERLGKHAAALESFQAAVRARPSYAKAHYNLALQQLRTGRLDEGRVALEQAVAHAPKFARARGELGRLLWTQRKPREALVQMRAAALQEPALEHLEPLAWALATCPVKELRAPAESLELAQRALGLARDAHSRARCLRALAAAQAGTGDRGEAVRSVEQALALLDAGAPLAAVLRSDLARYRR